MVKHLRFGLLFCALILFVSTGKAQKWYEMTLEDQVKIDDVKEEAEKYFAVRGKGPHTGYKGYMRWLYNAGLHSDKNGYIYTSDHLLKEKNKFKENTPKKRQVDTEGSWSAAGPFSYERTSSWSPGQGRVTAIAVEPNDQEFILVGTPGGGVWRSNDAGATWEPKGDNLEDLSVWAVGIDPNDPNHILHLNSGSYLLESYNQGDTWSTIASLGSRTRSPRMIKFHPTNSNIYFVSESDALFKTVNAGVTFTEVISEDVEDIFFKPGDENTMYASGDDFWKSTDLGENWTKVTNGISVSERIKITTTEADPDRVYLIQKSGSGFGRIYKSTDSGDSFQIMSDIDNGAPNYLGSQASRDMAIMCSHSNADEVHIAGLNNYRSQNGGVTFTSLADWNRPADPSYIHADVEVMISVNETLYAGTDGGIYRSANSGESYTDLTINGLAISQFYRLGSSAPFPGAGVGSDPDRIVAGSQDNGVLVARGVNKDWYGWLGADGMEGFIDYTNDDIIYGATQNGSLTRSTDGGNSFRGITEPTTEDGSWITPFEIDPQVHTTIYAGYQELYKSTNSGDGWEAMTTGQSEGEDLDEIAIAPSDNNYIYLAEADRLWVTTNGQSNSVTWNEVSGISGQINYISVDPNDAEHAIIATVGTNVYETKDAGSTWININSNLPEIGASCVLIDSSVNNGIYVGMSQGVYYKDDSMTNWELFGNGLPNCDIRELEINYQASKLRIATFGRGIWEIGVFGTREDITPQIIVETEGEKCLGDSIVLTVQNDPNWLAPISYKWYKDGALIEGATSSSYGAQENADYSVKVITDDASGVSSIVEVGFIGLPIAPSVTAEQICGAGTVTLTATGSAEGIIKWYSDVEGKNELAEGSTYSVGISETSSFYAQEVSNSTACSSLSNEAVAIVITPLDAPGVTDEIICTTGEVVLTATTSEDGTIRWYNEDNPNEIIETGETFTADVENTSTFLVDIEPEHVVIDAGLPLEGVNGGNSFGNWGLQFDVYQKLTLEAVQVNAQGAGERTIELFDSEGQLIWSKQVNLVTGVQRVELNLELEPGNEYRIGAPNGSNLSTGAGDLEYPLEASGLLSIEGAFRYNSPSVITSSYFFFYDWEITLPLETCVSEKVSLTVTVDDCVGLTDVQNENLLVYPNPSSGIINLQLPDDFDLKAIEVTDLRGNTFLAYGEYVDQIDLQGFNSGIYLVKVKGEQGSKIFKVEVN